MARIKKKGKKYKNQNMWVATEAVSRVKLTKEKSVYEIEDGHACLHTYTITQAHAYICINMHI